MAMTVPERLKSRKFTDRHGPFAYFSVAVAAVAAWASPETAVPVCTAIGAIYTFRAGDRAARGIFESMAKAENGGGP